MAIAAELRGAGGAGTSERVTARARAHGRRCDDVHLSRWVIERDLEAVLVSAKQMLAPGGQLIVNEPVLLANSTLPKLIGRMVGETRINEVVQQRTALDIGIELSTAGFNVINSRSEPEVTERLLMKLNQISMLLKMALRFSSFDPKSEAFPFTKKDLLKAFDELKKALDDETFGWHSWRATPN